MAMVARTHPSTDDRPFGMPIETLLHLPPPPSVNKVWKNYHRSPDYRWWIVAADRTIMAAGGVRRLEKMRNQFEVTITLDETLCKIDLDNGCKALIDYCKRIELIIDDDKRYLRQLLCRWGHAPLGCTVHLRSIA